MEEQQLAPQENMTDEEALMKLAQAMKDNAPSQEEKQNIHTFLTNVIAEEDTLRIAKLGNLRDDKEINELGMPKWNVRGALHMATISRKLMGNDFFGEFFEANSDETNATSLSREGFMIRQATTQTKQVADITKRRKTNKAWFKKSEEQQGGDTSGSAGN